MKDILEYTSYRQYIADYYAEKKAKSAFTWPEFASAAGFSSPVYLKYVSEGRFNLSEAAVERVGAAMHLSGNDLEFFREMVRFDHAKTDKAKKESFQKLVAMAESRKVKVGLMPMKTVLIVVRQKTELHSSGMRQHFRLGLCQKALM